MLFAFILDPRMLSHRGKTRLWTCMLHNFDVEDSHLGMYIQVWIAFCLNQVVTVEKSS